MRLFTESLGEEAEPVEKMLCGVDVERGSVLFGEGVERDFAACERGVFAEIDEGANWDQAASE